MLIGIQIGLGSDVADYLVIEKQFKKLTWRREYQLRNSVSRVERQCEIFVQKYWFCRFWLSVKFVGPAWPRTSHVPKTDPVHAHLKNCKWLLNRC